MLVKQSKFNKLSNIIYEMLLISLANSKNKFPVSFASPLQNRRFTYYYCLQWIFLRKIVIHNCRQFLLPSPYHAFVWIPTYCRRTIQTLHYTAVTNYRNLAVSDKRTDYPESWALIHVENQTLTYTRNKTFGMWRIWVPVSGLEQFSVCHSPEIQRKSGE